MLVAKKLANVLRGFIQTRGTRSAKRRLWNHEFAGGRWDYIDKTPGDFVYRFVERYANGGSILDLGCGSGNTGAELDENAYSKYTGVDISDVAVEKARKRSDECGRARKNEYFQHHVLTYRPAETCRNTLESR